MPITRVGDVELYHEIRGSGSRTPAVLLMGLGTDLQGWDFIVPRIEDRPLLLIDNRGSGRSSKPRGPYTTEALAADALAVMADAGWERAHVVGISLGGAIAQMLALAQPERVVSLALIATFTDLDAKMHATAEQGARVAAVRPPGTDIAQTMQAMAESNVEIDPRAMFKFLMPLVFTREFLEREKQLMREMFQRAMQNGISLQGFAGQLAAAWSHKTRDRLAHLRMPALVVMPEKDRLVPPAQSRAIAEAIPGARLHPIPDGVHACIIEGAEELGTLLDGWLKEND